MPSILYVNPVPVGVFIVMLPVEVVQVGCITVVLAIAGITGAELIIIGLVAEVHPAAFITVTVYEPGFRLVNVVVVWKFVPSIL